MYFFLMRLPLEGKLSPIMPCIMRGLMRCSVSLKASSEGSCQTPRLTDEGSAASVTFIIQPIRGNGIRHLLIKCKNGGAGSSIGRNTAVHAIIDNFRQMKYNYSIIRHGRGARIKHSFRALLRYRQPPAAV